MVGGWVSAFGGIVNMVYSVVILCDLCMYCYVVLYIINVNVCIN